MKNRFLGEGWKRRGKGTGAGLESLEQRMLLSGAVIAYPGTGTRPASTSNNGTVGLTEDSVNNLLNLDTGRPVDLGDGTFQVPITGTLKSGLDPLGTTTITLYDNTLALPAQTYTSTSVTFWAILGEGHHVLNAGVQGVLFSAFSGSTINVTGGNVASSNVELQLGRKDPLLAVTPSSTGATVALQTAVAAGATGTVTFTEVEAGGAALSSVGQTVSAVNGAARGAWPASGPGEYKFAVSYSGDAQFTPAQMTETTTFYVSSLALNESSAVGTPGQNPLLRATVTLPGGGVPGDAQFDPGAAVTDSQQTKPTTNVTLDWDVPQAQTFVPSPPTGVSGAINGISGVILINQHPSGAISGSLTNGFISPQAVLPTGAVNFYEGAKLLGSVNLDSAGANFRPSLGVGHHVITAQYAGDGIFLPATQTIPFDVVDPGTTTSASVGQAVTQGQDATVSLTTTSTMVDTKVLGGTYTLYEGAVKLASFGVAALGADYLALPLNSGDHVITVKYSGDGYFGPSQTDVTVHVVAATPSTALVPPAAGSAFPWATKAAPDAPPKAGDLVFAASYDEDAAGAGAHFYAFFWPGSPSVPTGSITFYDGTLPIATAPLVNGTADVTNMHLNGGQHLLAASYLGDGTHGAQGVQFHITVFGTQAAGGAAGDATNRYVTRLYGDVLGRAADPGGLAFWSQLLDSAQATPQQVTAALAHSAEGLAKQVRDLYQQVLQRPADPSGLATWTGYLARGWTVDAVRNALYGSGEFVSDNGNNLGQWLSAVYQGVMGRSADATGTTYWLAKIGQGSTTTQVVTAVAQSTEGSQHVVQSLYHLYLGRAADGGGLAYWSAAYAANLDSSLLETALTGSVEYCVGS